MPFAVSPAVVIREIDNTLGTPQVSTTEAGFAGTFAWGEINKRVLVESETKLVQKFGKPNDTNYETWFTAASFLAYGKKLYISRAVDSNVKTALANTGSVANALGQRIYNADHYETVTIDANVAWLAKYPGALGNSLRISICDSPTAFSQDIDLFSNASITAASISFVAGSNTATISVTSTSNATAAAGSFTTSFAKISVGDLIQVGNSTVGTQFLKVTAKGTSTNTTNGGDFTTSGTLSFSSPVTLVSNVSSNTVSRKWEFYNAVDRAPGTSVYLQRLSLTTVDEMHIVVVDEQGKFTGNPGQILETFKGLSRATDSLNENGGSNFYKTVIASDSAYVWAGTQNSNALANVATSLTNSTNSVPVGYSFTGGADTSSESTIALSALTAAYDLYASADEADISILITGKARGAATSGVSTAVNSHGGLANYLIQNLAEVRKDCVVTLSPASADVVNALNPLDNVLAFRNNLASSSYGIMDSGYKQMYDRYNDKYRFVPLCGDIAGALVRTDNDADTWFSPAGQTRGQIKNVVKLAFNPTLAQRDQLYKLDVNPVVSFVGEGTMLFGDKTLYGKPSAFDRINVRRLFIYLRKTLSKASRSLLFEFNDEFTRAQFRNLVEPLLRTIKGRRGIYDFVVKCDEENNTGDVIDRNEFIGDIYIKPARSVNFILLNLVAVGTSASFSESIVSG